MAEDAGWKRNELHNQISQELVSVRDLAKDAELGGNCDSDDDKTVEKSSLSKKPNVYLNDYKRSLQAC